MKTFLNVLYRRILYKIPLKLLLVLLAVFGILFACFSNADEIQSITLQPGATWTKTLNSHASYDSSNSIGNVLCIETRADEAGGSSCNSVKVTFQDGTIATGNPFMGTDYTNGKMFCTIGGVGTFNVKNTSSATCLYHIIRFDWTALIDSLTCQTQYNLIPISSVDQNYCTTNNLCPSCPSCPSCPVGTGGYSQLYINNILHLGAPSIIMNIPDEIDWDYAYTQGGQNMNIDVVGYNVDYEKIDSIVQFQNYKPTGEDFQKIIGLLAPYTKIIVFFVFLFIVWAWIKKPFKSKKL